MIRTVIHEANCPMPRCVSVALRSTRRRTRSKCVSRQPFNRRSRSGFGLTHTVLLMVVLGLFTRAAAFGMIGFIVVQSLTDLFGHGGIAHKGTLGAWFDRLPDGLILDQRAFWVFVLLYLVLRGGGPLSVDRVLLGSKSGASEEL